MSLLLALTAGTPEASTDAQLAEPFTTRTSNSRRQLAAGWMAGMAAQVQAAAVPCSAWMTLSSPRRKATERRILEAPALHWQYIAPTIAAILPRPTAKVVQFRRTIQLPQPQALYPPPTGPPDRYPSWAAIAVKRVSQDRKLQAQAEVPYPAASVPASTDSSLAEPFVTWRGKSRKLIQPLVTPEFPATPATLTAQGFPAYLLRAVSRSETRRRLQTAIDAPVYPQPSTPPVVEFAAFTPVKVRRRKSSGMGFVAVDFMAGSPTQPTTTPAVHPAHVPTGYLRRRETDRRHLTALVAPVFPATPAAEGSTDSALAEPFTTRISRSRKHLVAMVTPSYPAPPAPPEVVYAALVTTGFHRRKPRNAGFVAVDVLTGRTVSVAVYPSFVPQGFIKRTTTERRHIAAIDAPSKPQTPPVPEQPFTAFKLAVARYTPPQRRTHLFVLGPLHVEGSLPPVVTPDTGGGGGWWPPYDYYRHRKELEHRERRQRKVEAERIEDETAREIARLLHEQEQRDAERADLKRLQQLAADAQNLRETGLFNDAIERRLHLLAIETTISQLLAFERELAQQIEDEEMAALLLILAEETD